MTSRFVDITSAEMWRTLVSIVGNLPQKCYINSISGGSFEEVYEIVLNDVQSIYVYTSIDLKTRLNRENGRDAIRLVLNTRHPGTRMLSDYISHERICRINRTEGWQVRLQNRIYEAIEKENIDDMDFKPAQGVLMPDLEPFEKELVPLAKTDTCIVCGNSDVNGRTKEGYPVCAWHQHVVVGFDMGSGSDSSVLAQFRNGKMVAHSFLGKA